MRALALSLAACLLSGPATGCGGGGDDDEVPPGGYTVSITWIDAHVTDDQLVYAPRDLSASSVSLHALVDGAWMTLPGSATAGGAITVAGVPARDALLQVDDTYWEIDAAASDRRIGYRLGGRPDVVTPGGVTSLQLSFDQIDAWQASDDLVLFSAGAGYSVGLAHTGFQVIPDGATSISDFAARYADQPLIQASQGDDAWLLQTRIEDTADGPVERAVRYAALTLEQVTGQPATLAGSLLGDGGLPFAIDAELDIPALIGAIGSVPSAQFVLPTFSLTASPWVDGAHARLPFAILYAIEPTERTEAYAVRASAIQPFPAAWLTYSYGVTFSRPVAVAETGPDRLNGILWVDAEADAAGSRPLLALPHVTVDGVDGFSAGGTTGATPDVEWDAPGATGRAVEVYRLATANGFTVDQRVAIIYPFGDRLTLPGDLLTSGETYALRVSVSSLTDGAEARATTPTGVLTVE